MRRLSFANDGGLLQSGENDGKMLRQIFANDGDSLTGLMAVTETFHFLLADGSSAILLADGSSYLLTADAA